MRFADSETQRLLRNTARSYLAGAYGPERLRRIELGEERIDGESLREIAGLGWFGLIAPEDAGGGGASLLDAAVVIDELGYAGVAAPVAVANIAAAVLSAASDQNAARPHIERLAGGASLCTVNESTRAHSSRPDALSISSARVEGTLTLVPFADVSASILAPVSVDGEPAIALLSLEGAELTPVQVLDRRPYAHVRFGDSKRIETLATGGEARALHERLDALVTAFGIVEQAGAMQRVLDMTVGHISTRVQFGQPIAKFQAARHRAAELLMQVETVRWAAYHALWRFQLDPLDTEEIWLAKHWAVRAADRVFQISHLLHGGIGVSVEHPLHLFTQAVTAMAVRGGTMNELTARATASIRVP